MDVATIKLDQINHGDKIQANMTNNASSAMVRENRSPAFFFSYFLSEGIWAVYFPKIAFKIIT